MTHRSPDGATCTDVEVELHDKAAALRQLARIHGMDRGGAVSLDASHSSGVTITIDAADADY